MTYRNFLMLNIFIIVTYLIEITSPYRHHMLKHDNAILIAHCVDIWSTFSVTAFAFSIQVVKHMGIIWAMIQVNKHFPFKFIFKPKPSANPLLSVLWYIQYCMNGSAQYQGLSLSTFDREISVLPDYFCKVNFSFKSTSILNDFTKSL